MRHQELTYPEVGATAADLPTGYHTIDLERRVGTGREWFATAGERLLTWEVQRRAGLRVNGPPRVTLGAEAVLGAKVGLVWLSAPVRVVAVLVQPNLVGFAYGTLPTHPEIGEERFFVTIDGDGTVRAHIRAFSRPGRLLTRLGGPLGRRMQRSITERYFVALTEEH